MHGSFFARLGAGPERASYLPVLTTYRFSVYISCEIWFDTCMEMRAMNVRVEIDGTIENSEIVIRVRARDGEADRLERAVREALESSREMAVYKEDGVYYLPLPDILFFETEGEAVYAHTADDMYAAKKRLYELEELLPNTFMRVSKSTVLNLSAVSSVTRTFPSACTAQFLCTHKQVYVSRSYYKLLRERLEEKRK